MLVALQLNYDLHRCNDLAIFQSAVLKTSGNANNQDNVDHPNIMYRVPERVHQDNNSKCGDRSSTASSFSAWRSNCRNPIYASRLDEMWPRLEYWWNMLKWPLVLLLICSILGLFIYFLVIGNYCGRSVETTTVVHGKVTCSLPVSEMEINESLLNTDKAIESNIFLREMNYQEMHHNVTWLHEANDTQKRANNSGAASSINKTSAVQRPYSPTNLPTTTFQGQQEHSLSTDVALETSTGDTLQKQFGFTSGHQNNFGVPIEEDARILKRLNDELQRIHNGTTTPRVSTTTDEYRTKVSPTLPLIRKTPESSTERLNLSRLTNDECVSTSLPLCRGVLHYDLTTLSTQAMSDEETVLFKYLLDSRCSSRAAQFMCSLFEPECRPAVMSDTLPPCKRFCKCE